jgi:phosphoribosyl 1,2-cyclic phosphodiesterase
MRAIKSICTGKRTKDMLELCSIASGSSGNCICAGTDTCHVLIDAGISGKKVEQGLESFGLKADEIQGILITHEHIDHIAGVGVLARRYGIPLYATQGTIEAVRQTKVVGIIDKSLFHPIVPGESFVIGDMTFLPLPISHDAAEPVAYRFTNGKRRFAVVTDLGTYDRQLVDQLQGLDALLLEANHDIRMLETGVYPYPLKQRILGDKGHLSNERSGQLLCELLHDRFGTVMLGHLSKENNYEQLAYETVRLEITLGDNPYKAEDFPLYVANRDTVSPAIRAE